MKIKVITLLALFGLGVGACHSCQQQEQKQIVPLYPLRAK